jgi:hypothetical protein
MDVSNRARLFWSRRQERSITRIEGKYVRGEKNTKRCIRFPLISVTNIVPIDSTATGHISIFISRQRLVSKYPYFSQTHASTIMPPLPPQYFLGTSTTLSSHDHVIIYRGHSSYIEPYSPVLESTILLLVAVLVIWSVLSSAYTTIHLVDWLWEYSKFSLEAFSVTQTKPPALRSDSQLKEDEVAALLGRKRQCGQHEWTIVERKGCWDNVDQWVPVPVVDRAVAMKESYERLVRQRAKTI